MTKKISISPNPSVAIKWQDIPLQDRIPEFVSRDYEIYWKDPVANLCWEYLKFTNSKVFSPAASEFLKNHRYCPFPEGTIDFYKFWKEEKRRILEGFTVGGVRISGEHYFYLNYCQILKTTVHPITHQELKTMGFPDFLDMDYYYFLELEKNENPQMYGLPLSERRGMLVAKSRRKGWSYKNAAGLSRIFLFFKESYSIVTSYYDEHGDATMKMTLGILNFLNEHSEFRHPRLIDRSDEIKSGYKERIDGIDIERGYQSTIKQIVFKDSFGKTAGKSASRIIFEEAGLMKNLKLAFTMSEPLLRDGVKTIGTACIFGTGGDQDSATQDFAEMFYDPASSQLAAYDNIYETTDNLGKCGYFVDEFWYRPGDILIQGQVFQGVDENGNANRWAAEISLEQERQVLRKGDRKQYHLAITQKCKTPAEAFMVSEGTIFPAEEIYPVLAQLKSSNTSKYIGVPISLFYTPDDKVDYAPDHSAKLVPINHYPLKTGDNTEGCVVMYEAPVMVEGKVPQDMYIIGYDPYGLDEAGEGASLGAAYVLKTPKYRRHGYNEIVAEYVGRSPGGLKGFHYNVEKLSVFYGNAKIMFENDRGEVKAFFEKRRKLYLLAEQPDTVISKAVSGPKIQRIYGSSMSSQAMKGAAETYVLDFLLETRGSSQDGRSIRNLDLIPSIGLLEELVRYNRQGNFDRVCALMQLVICLEERYNEYLENATTTNNGLDYSFLINNKSLFPGYNKQQYEDRVSIYN